MRGELVKADRNLKEATVGGSPGDRGNSRDADATETLRLVKRAQAGDQPAFARLVEPYMRKTYYAALKITRNHQDAEDASQQAFLKALANIGQFRGASQFSTWLTRIAMNEALVVMRKRRSEDFHLTYDVDSGNGSAAIEGVRAASTMQPEALYARGEEQRLLREAIGGLRGTLRAVVWLLGLEEQKSREAAQILHLSETAVKIRFLRARRELRECLADRI
jgi:RNA polymerase sigma-70 factor (ECF subfamily)